MFFFFHRKIVTKLIKPLCSIPAPDLVSFHTVLSALQRSGRGVEAEQILERMRTLSIEGGAGITRLSLSSIILLHR
jgi:pentatricopeptide repeat protein